MRVTLFPEHVNIWNVSVCPLTAGNSVWDAVFAFTACVTGVTGRCSLFGRDHIHTFDGVLYQFPGDCSYLLAGDCNHRSFSLLGEMQRLLLWFVMCCYICNSVLPCYHNHALAHFSFKKNLVLVLYSIHRGFCEWQKSWSDPVSGRCIWTSPFCRRTALSRRNKV